MRSAVASISPSTRCSSSQPHRYVSGRSRVAPRNRRERSWYRSSPHASRSVAFGECPTVASNCLRDKLEACRDVRPFLLCAAGHLVEHLGDVLERTGDVVEIAEVLACFKEVEMDAEAFEHDAARDPICPCWA